MHYLLIINILIENASMQAYIDAGTGSLIIQIVIGGLAGGLLALKIFWSRIRRWFKKPQPSEKESVEIQAKSKNE